MGPGTMTSRGGWRIAVTCAATAIAVLMAAGALVACGDEPPAAPTGGPSITGIVASATPLDGGAAVGSFLIDEGAGDYDKASVAVTDETSWHRRAGGDFVTIERPTAGAVAGEYVEVRFTGPVAESYPVQATADWVIVGR